MIRTADPLRIFLTVDLGPARATLPPSGANPDWEPTFAGIPILRSAMERLADLLSLAVPSTWYVRADAEVAGQFGDPLSVYRRFRSIKGAHQGEEAGWMPLVPFGASGERDIDDLARVHGRIVDDFGAVVTTRMGNLSHDDATMAALDSLGVRIDCTAIPGRTKHDPGWTVDWSTTPEHAYHPSFSDYRRPGTPARRILEVPMQSVPMQAAYDSVPLGRYVNPCYRPEILWQRLSALLPLMPYLVCLLHPDELVAGTAGHPMVAYSRAAFAANMARIVSEARASGRAVTFERISDFEFDPAAAEGQPA